MPVTPDDHLAQSDFDVRTEWGPNGLRRLAPHCPTIVIVDVLSFTTCVDVALGRGAAVLPYRWHDGGEHDHAAAHDAVVAVGRDDVDVDHPWSLSPGSLATIPAGTRLVLPSPNGAALAFGAADAGAGTVIAACLRNATAVGRWLERSDGPIGLVPAGERWRGSTGPMRPALEDLLGAGAVAAALADAGRSLSPESRSAAAAWRDASGDEVRHLVATSVSGRELFDRGWPSDVEVATAVDGSEVVPLLRDAAFVDGAASPVGRAGSESGRRWNLDGGIDEVSLPDVEGRLWLCGKHLIGPDVDAAIARADADTVVCLTEEHELADRYPDYVAWLRAQADERAVWRPIPDLSMPPLDELFALLDDLVTRLRAGEVLIVHCAAGIGRSGTVAVALLLLLGLPLDVALDRVAASRSLAGPESGAQTELVEALATRLDAT